MNAHVGTKAPDFRAEAVLPNGEFGEVKLGDFAGRWVVLFFYPLDFTFVCPTEIKAFNEAYDRFKKAGTEVLAVSTDSVYSHKAWQEHGLGRLKFPHLADTSRKLSQAFNVLIEDKGIALRGTFIIDDKGVLRHATINDTGVGRSVEETLRTLHAFQSGKLTGCDWKPGDKTLN
jgi:alkyl hydroperoxide reductase subunit AhpC